MVKLPNQSKQHKFTHTLTTFLPTKWLRTTLYWSAWNSQKDAYVGLLKARHTGPKIMTCQLTSACCLQWICILCLKSVFIQCFSFHNYRALPVLGGHAWTGSPLHLRPGVIRSLPELLWWPWLWLPLQDSVPVCGVSDQTWVDWWRRLGHSEFIMQ